MLQENCNPHNKTNASYQKVYCWTSTFQYILFKMCPFIRQAHNHATLHPVEHNTVDGCCDPRFQFIDGVQSWLVDSLIEEILQKRNRKALNQVTWVATILEKSACYGKRTLVIHVSLWSRDVKCFDYNRFFGTLVLVLKIFQENLVIFARKSNDYCKKI